MAKPDFNHKSWDATYWSLWGLLYTGADSDAALKTAISQAFGEAETELSRLGPQVDPLAATVKEWTDEVSGYGRTITYGEANEVLLRLQKITKDAKEQAEADRLLIEANKKPKAKKPKKPKKPKHVPEVPDEEEDEAALAWAEQHSNTVSGHSKATARAKPNPVKPKQVYVPPTPEQIWRDEQRTLANECDNGIAFGTHGVNQESVLRHLDLEEGDSIVKQYRSGPENSHKRIMNSKNGDQYWTLGLTHREMRDPGNFSVYRRVGAKSQFVFVSGRRHPKDPAL